MSQLNIPNRLCKIPFIGKILGFSLFICSTVAITTAAAQSPTEQKNIPQIKDEVDLRKYEPFRSDTLAVKLDEPATLQLQQNLPRIDGATALYPLYSAFVQAVYPQPPEDYYERRDRELLEGYLDVAVRCSTTPRAYERLIAGQVDVIFVAAPSEVQLELAKSKNVEMQLTPIGREAFVFFVNHNNPVNGLSVEQIQKIYSGKLTNWQEVGGKDEAIRPFQRPKDSGSQTALEKIMKGKRIIKPLTEERVKSMGDIIQEVAQYRNYDNGLGYSFLFFATQMVRNNQIKLLAINGIAPTKQTIADGSYPFSKPFYAVSRKGQTSPETQQFIDWILGPQGQRLIAETGYVPLHH